MVSDRIYLALGLAFQCQGWMKSRFRTLSVDNFTLKSWNNLWNENSKVWKHRRRQLLHAEQTACLFSILCAFKSAFRTNCAWHSSLEIWVLDFVKIACTLICECLKIFLMISLSEHKQNLCFLVMFFSQGERHNPRYLCNVWNEWECILFLSQIFLFLRKNGDGGLERSTPAVSKCFSYRESRKRERCNQRKP